VFHVLALLREGDGRLHGEIRNPLDAGERNRGQPVRLPVAGQSPGPAMVSIF
jgi:hypothetical protein